MKILNYISKFWNFITDPKNRKIRNLLILVILIGLIFIQGCRANKFKQQAIDEKEERIRIENNYKAAKDTLEQYKLDEDTWIAEKKGFEITIDELNEEYGELLGDYKFEKNKPPKTIVKTKYEIVESVKEIPVYVSVNGDSINLDFSDSAQYSDNNYRYLTADIRARYSIQDSTLIINESSASATFDLKQGVELRTYLLKDEMTKEVSIIVETDYPNLNFTDIQGANIIGDPNSKEAVRSLRKPFAITFQAGYGLLYETQSNRLYNGPTLSVGIGWQPKFLQFGK